MYNLLVSYNTSIFLIFMIETNIPWLWSSGFSGFLLNFYSKQLKIFSKFSLLFSIICCFMQKSIFFAWSIGKVLYNIQLRRPQQFATFWYHT